MKEKEKFEVKQEVERAVLVGAIMPDQEEYKIKEYLDELAFLTETSGAETVKIFTQKISNPNPKTFIGSGKINEIKEFVKEHDIDMVIFDDELSASQLRNIERIFEIKILDRANLILDIFAKRARTSHAKKQVELAQCQYLLPRLTRMWTHLERQKGGIGMRGPGETQIETDRRIIQQKIALLKKDLEKIDKQKATQRGGRGKLVRVALIGYTNVGKSTLMNLLSKSDVFAENKLFATLDTTVRKITIQNIPFLLSDTVGFIRKLPHMLVESFKSTLDEVREADILLHVVDISHHNFEEHYQIVKETLIEIEAAKIPSIIVFNKLDAFTNYEERDDELLPVDEHITLEGLQKTWMAKLENDNCIFISAQEKLNIEEFRKLLYEKVKAIHIQRFPYNDFLYEIYN